VHVVRYVLHNEFFDFKKLMRLECGQPCILGMYNAGASEYCGPGSNGGPSLTQTLCCPFGSVPDPETCTWRVGAQGLLGLSCSGSCQSDEVSVATSTDPYVNGQHLSCFSGFAEYCCKGTFPIDDVCSWTSSCVDIVSSGTGGSTPDYFPKDMSVCGSELYYLCSLI
jgi:chitinase